MKRIAAVVGSGFAVLLAGMATSGAPAAPAATTVKVRLMEMMVMPAPSEVRAGRVTFVVKNAGKAKHNLVVLKTNLAPSKLPMAGAAAKEVGRVAKTPVFGPGQTRRLTLTLKRGSYLLICNVAGHYMAGMRVAFRVA